MTAARARPPADRLGIGPFVLLGATLVLLAGQAPSGLAPALVVVGVGLALSAAWRRVGRSAARGGEVVPVAVVLAYLLVVAPPNVVTEVLAGLGGVALLLWLGAGPDGAAGRWSRALDLLVVPLAALAIALGTTFILPSLPTSIGLATILLVAVMIGVAILLVRLSAGARAEAPSS